MSQPSDHRSGLEHSDLAPTGIKVYINGSPIALELATAVEIRRHCNSLIAAYRASWGNGQTARTRAARELITLAKAKPWLMDQVPWSVWDMALADMKQ